MQFKTLVSRAGVPHKASERHDVCIVPKPKPKKSRKGDEDKIPRPMNAFMIFSKGRRAEIRQQNPNMHNAVISAKLGQEWRQLVPEQQKMFYRRAEEMLEEHKRSYPDYKYQPQRKKTKPAAAAPKSRQATKEFKSTAALKKTPVKAKVSSPKSQSQRTLRNTPKTLEIKIRLPLPGRGLKATGSMVPALDSILAASPASSEDEHALTPDAALDSRPLPISRVSSGQPSVMSLTEPITTLYHGHGGKNAEVVCRHRISIDTPPYCPDKPSEPFSFRSECNSDSDSSSSESDSDSDSDSSSSGSSSSDSSSDSESDSESESDSDMEADWRVPVRRLSAEDRLIFNGKTIKEILAASGDNDELGSDLPLPYLDSYVSTRAEYSALPFNMNVDGSVSTQHGFLGMRSFIVL